MVQKAVCCRDNVTDSHQGGGNVEQLSSFQKRQEKVELTGYNLFCVL